MDMVQILSTGGAAAVLAWLVLQYTKGEILSRAAHLEIVGPLKETVAHLRKELRETNDASRQAILDITSNQRVTMEEQAKTIEVLRGMLASHGITDGSAGSGV